MARRTDRVAGEAGFTLVEMLVSLALLGLAALLLCQGLAMAAALAGRVRDRADALAPTLAAQRVLRSSIERLRPILRIDSATPLIELRGTAGILTYIAPPLDQDAPDALQRFRLTRTAGGDLVLFSADSLRRSIDRSGGDLIGWTPHTLLRGVRDLAIAYYGAAATGPARGWQDRWWDRPSPPDLIRIRVRFAEGDRRPWPDLVVRPRATMRTGCRLDTLSGRCAIAP